MESTMTEQAVAADQSQEEGQSLVASEEGVIPSQPKEPTSDYYAKLAKIESERQSLQERLSGYDNQLKSKEEEFSKQLEEYKKLLKEGEKNPNALLERVGYTPESYADYLMNNGNVPQEKVVEELQAQLAEKNNTLNEVIERLSRLEGSNEHVSKTIADSQAQIVIDRAEHVINNDDSYKLLRGFGDVGIQMVLQTKLDALGQDGRGRNLSDEEAASAAQEQVKDYVMGLLKIDEVMSIARDVMGVQSNVQGDQGQSAPDLEVASGRPSVVEEKVIKEKVTSLNNDMAKATRSDSPPALTHGQRVARALARHQQRISAG